MTGGVQEYGIVALVVGLCLGFFEVLKKMIPALAKNGTSAAGYLASDRERDNKLYSLHNQNDEDGTPIWYVPRSMEKTLDRMLDELREINQKLS